MAVAEELGSNAVMSGGFFSFSGAAYQFERGETVFSVKFRRYKYAADSIISFDILPIQEKFFIRHKSVSADLNVWSEGNEFPSSDCQPVSVPALSQNYLLYSLNSDFLLSLLKEEKVISQIAGYRADWGRYIKIAFVLDHFELTLHSNDLNAETFRQICETSIIFHDRIKEMTKNGHIKN